MDSNISYQYNTHTAEGFDTIYGLGHEYATSLIYRLCLQGILAHMTLGNQAAIDAVKLLAARQYREDQQRVLPNFTDDDERFDAAWAAGYVVAWNAEQDAFHADPERYQAALRLRFAAQLPPARIVEAQE